MLSELSQPTRELRAAIPDTWSGFVEMHRSALGDGALSTTIKELIALAISISSQCDGCIAHHARAAARSGATAEEVAETIGVALLMNGGTASVYGPRAWAAFHEFATHRTEQRL